MSHSQVILSLPWRSVECRMDFKVLDTRVRGQERAGEGENGGRCREVKRAGQRGVKSRRGRMRGTERGERKETGGERDESGET